MRKWLREGMKEATREGCNYGRSGKGMGNVENE